MATPEQNIELVQPPTKPANLSGVDRVQSLKQLAQINRTDRQVAASTSSLENPNTADLYSARSNTAAGAPGDRQHSKAPGSGEQQLATQPTPATNQPELLANRGEAAKNSRHAPELIGHVVPESQHTTTQGETLEGIARRRLGPTASENEVQRYAWVAAKMNHISDARTLWAGDKLHLPGHGKDGSITFTNPDNKAEHWSYLKDGTLEVHNKSDGTSFTQTQLDDFGSYQEHDKGPKPDDNYDVTYINKDHYTLTSRQDADGSTVTTGSDGFKKVTDKKGNWFATNSPSQDPAKCSYDKETGVTTQQFTDGSTVKIFEKDNHSEEVLPNGTKTTKWADDSLKVERKDAEGHEIGYTRHPDGKGGYTEHGWGPQPKDNYDETYSAKSGTTTRVEAKGRPEETTTTKLADGTLKVERKDGENYQRNLDGSEHHWGKENYDKPAYDFKHDEQLKKSKEALNAAVRDHLPTGKQAAFHKDMTEFEARAHRDHLSPEEVAKTYDQISQMLDTPEQKAVVSGANRALLAEGLMHQCAHPGDTDQGKSNTCNVTTVLKRTLFKNPSKAAEMAATTAVRGEWTAADGHVAQIDKQSLQPQAEESVYPPATSGNRTFATQVLNLVMVNDALQRRPSPQYYVQRTPDHSNPDDTGERRLDSDVIRAQQYDASKDVWRISPDSTPGLTNREVAQIGKRLNGDAGVVSVNDPSGDVESTNSEQTLAAKLHQLKQQGEFPITLAVDSHHIPIEILDNESPSYGGHFVTVDAYDEKTGKVHVSNQWGKASKKWVNMKELYRNSSGDYASSQDGVDTGDYQ